MDILIETMQDSLWAAAVEDKRMEGIEVDPPLEGVRWGAIHYARVTRVDSTLGAAFLDIGHGEQGILYARDYRVQKQDGSIGKNEGKSIGQLFHTGDMVLVQAKTSTLPLEMHQDITLFDDKVARMSMDISISGRHLIYTPLDNEKRVSSRIKESKLRKRMLTMAKKVETIQGCILRSSAANVQTDVLIRESKILRRIWEQLSEYARGEVPNLIMEGPDALQRLISDHADRSIDRIITTSAAQFEETEEWCDIYAPDLVPKVQLHEIADNRNDIGLLDQYDLIEEVQGLIRPYVVLPGGGNIIIQKTNALTAIDINSGVCKSKSRVNIEAAKEIPRQLRLRNIGGIVMVDFIRGSKKAKEALLSALKEECAKDPCSIDIHGFTNTGMVEMTRARRTAPLLQRLQIATAVSEAT